MSPYYIPLPRTLVVIAAFSVALFWTVSSFIPVNDFTAVVLQSARLSISVMVAAVYGYSFTDFWQKNERGGASLVALSITMLFAAHAFSSGLSIYWRIMGRPPEWAETQIWLFGPYVTAIAAIMLVLSPGNLDGRIPKRNVWLGGIAIGLSMLLAVLVISMSLWVQVSGRSF